MKKGEIWTTVLPFTNGHEQHGARPAVILADATSSLAVVAPCTGNLGALRFPYTLRVPASESNGLAALSIVLALQLRVIDKKRLQRKIGSLELAHMAELDQTLKRLFAL